MNEDSRRTTTGSAPIRPTAGGSGTELVVVHPEEATRKLYHAAIGVTLAAAPGLVEALVCIERGGAACARLDVVICVNELFEEFGALVFGAPLGRPRVFDL